MPITAWLCKSCGGREVPLDHFDTTACGEKVHPDYANMVLEDRAGHYATGSGIVEVSHMIDCPRKYAIADKENYAVDPVSMNAMLTGTAWHEKVARHTTAPDETEQVVRGTILGVPVQGKVDRTRRHLGLIEDWKHQNDYASKSVKDGPKKDHLVQCGLYAELIQQTHGWRPARTIIWSHFSAAPGVVPLMAPTMSLKECLEHHPKGGDATVAELLGAANSYQLSDNWKPIKLYGQSMSYGAKSGCDYCSVFDICMRQAKGAAF